MDDPLVPKEYGSGSKWLGLCAALSSFIFVLVTVVLAAASGSPSWIVAAIGMFMIIGTTATILQWIRTGQLEEAKHTYLVAVQVLGLMVIAGAILDILYTKDAMYPVVGTVTGAFISPNVATPGSISFNGGAPVTLPAGYVVPLVLAAEVADGSSVSVVMVDQPGQAFCTAVGSGTVSGKVFNQVNISCVPRYNFGGSLSGLLPGYTPLQMKATFTPDASPQPTPHTASLSADGGFYFKDKFDGGVVSVYVEITAAPASSDGKTTLTCTDGGTPFPKSYGRDSGFMGKQDFNQLRINCAKAV